MLHIRDILYGLGIAFLIRVFIELFALLFF